MTSMTRTPARDVNVRIPPISGEFRGFPGFVQVGINAERSSIFGGIIGRSEWPVSVVAVAANQPGVTYTFGMLALNEEACKAIHISGTGQVNSAANVQSNSNGAGCGDGSNIGFSRTGSGVLNVTAPDAVCRSVGEIQDQGSRVDDLRAGGVLVRVARIHSPVSRPPSSQPSRPG